MGPDGGGIASLGLTLNLYWDAVEADFQRFYGVDLRREVEAMGVRRIFALVKNLPPEAALWRAMPRPESGEDQSNGDGHVVTKGTDARTIAAWFNKNIGAGSAPGG